MKQSRCKESNVSRPLFHHALSIIAAVLLLFPLSLLSLRQISAVEANRFSFIKRYVSEGEGASAPEADFAFQAELYDIEPFDESEVDIDDVPDSVRYVTVSEGKFSDTVHFDQDETEKEVVVLPPKLTDIEAAGKYYYKLKEVQGETAGITYDHTVYDLIIPIEEVDGKYCVQTEGRNRLIRILNEEGTKVTEIVNRYSAGSLTISKHLDGKRGEEDSFEASLTLTSDKEVASVISITGIEGKETIKPEEWQDGKVRITFPIEPNSTYTFANIPDGIGYDVEETPVEGYDITYSQTTDEGTTREHSGTIQGKKNVKLTITNTAANDVTNTAARADGIPYLGMLAMTLVAAILLLIRLKWQLSSRG